MFQEVKDESAFKSAIEKGKVIVDFWAPWCGPCQMMGRVIAEELIPNRPDITVVKVNVDEAQLLAAQFGVMSIPTLLCYKDGVQTASFVGVQPIKTLLGALD